MRVATSSAMRGWTMAFSAARSPASAKTLAAQHAGKARGDLAQGRPAGFHHLARHQVGVDHRDPARGEHSRHRALAGADVAG